MDATVICPHCQRQERQVKAGMNGGNQRFKCGFCGRRYTPNLKERGYSEDLRSQALLLRQQGLTAAQIGREIGVSSRSIANWMRSAAEIATAAIAPEEPAADMAAPERRRPTIQDVADTAGVSTSTVSNYLNRTGRMSRATRERIQTTIQALHFTPNYFVRAVRQRRTRIIGLLTYGLSDLDSPSSVTARLLQGINDAASRAEHEILLYTNWWQPEKHYTGLSFLSGQVDGLIWVAPEEQEPLLERVAAAGLPVIALLTRHVPEGVGYINADNAGATRRIVEHLAASGHRRMMYLGPAHSSNYKDRREGFRQAVTGAGLAKECIEVCPRVDIWLWAHYEQALENSANAPFPPTAFVAADDGMAILVGQWLEKRGYVIGKDAAVAGFNDVPAAETQFGGLTTIRQPFRRMAQISVERLIARVEGAPVSECRVTLPAELVIRSSSGPRK